MTEPTEREGVPGLTRSERPPLSMSKKYGPPKISLRDARILDDYGDESHATRPIQHRVPEDVSKEDFDFYRHVFSFMEFADLLFQRLDAMSRLPTPVVPVFVCCVGIKPFAKLDGESIFFAWWSA